MSKHLTRVPMERRGAAYRSHSNDRAILAGRAVDVEGQLMVLRCLVDVSQNRRQKGLEGPCCHEDQENFEARRCGQGCQWCPGHSQGVRWRPKTLARPQQWISNARSWGSWGSGKPGAFLIPCRRPCLPWSLHCKVPEAVGPICSLRVRC